MDPARSPSGRVAVVTGGASGFGAAMVRNFVAAGMHVAILDLDEPRAQELAGELGGRTTAHGVDVGDPVSIAAAAAHVESTLGACHLLCANVGVVQFGGIDRLSDEEWNWVLNVNVVGTARTVRAFLPLMRRDSGWRQIALTASSSALTPGARLGAYSASKFAVMAIGETLRHELAPEGIGVTVIFPAGMSTRHVESSGAARPEDLPGELITDEDVAVMMASRKIDQATFTASPEHAARNVLADLLADEPFVITHGPYRAQLEHRLARLGQAFDRMEQA